MKYGDIILFTPTSITGRLISMIDGSPYSHVGIFIKYENGIPLFLESHEKKNGVVLSRLEEWGNYKVLRPVALVPRFKADLVKLLGTKYDFSMIVWICVAKFLHKKEINNDFSKLICSELVDYTYHYSIGKGEICTPRMIAESELFTQVYL